MKPESIKFNNASSHGVPMAFGPKEENKDNVFLLFSHCISEKKTKHNLRISEICYFCLFNSVCSNSALKLKSHSCVFQLMLKIEL